jgi:hypothetical protein
VWCRRRQAPLHHRSLAARSATGSWFGDGPNVKRPEPKSEEFLALLILLGPLAYVVRWISRRLREPACGEAYLAAARASSPAVSLHRVVPATARQELHSPAWNGYLPTVACPCGVVFGRWVTPEDADVDLLHLAWLN